VARAKASADRIEQTGRYARQEQELYAALTSAANACRVRIDQMSPSKLGSGKGGHAPTGPEMPENGPNAAVGYTIDATATYTDLAAFLKSIRTDLGYSLIKSVRLNPTQDTKSKMVHAYIETEHFSFDASPVALGTPGGPADSGAH